MSTEENLKAWTLDIVAKINARDAHTAITTYASPEYTYENTEDNGSILTLNATEMLRLRDLYFSRLSPDVYAEVRSTEVNLDKELWGATVWVGMVVHNDARGVLRERMNIFFWRFERGRWVWWKEHTSAGIAPQSDVV